MGLTASVPLGNVQTPDDIELLQETKLFAAWTLDEVTDLSERFQRRFGFAITFAQFEELLLLKNNQLIDDSAVDNKKIFAALDRNRDGRIDGLEFLAALTCCCRASFERKVRFAFELFDFNQNGSLSVTELALLLKSVWMGMRLFTGGDVLENGSSAPMETTPIPIDRFLQFSQAAFHRFDKDQNDPLNYEEFVEWARSNREFMLQVERFRLVCEKALNSEEEMSIPSSSDVDSDLDIEVEFDESDVAVPENRTIQTKSTNKSPNGRSSWTLQTSPSFSTLSISPPSSSTPPSLNVDLEWVYGTRTHATRGSVRFLSNGDVVYFVAKHAVVYNTKNHHQRFYSGHVNAITAMDVNSKGEIVATADTGGNPKIHVWHGFTLQCLAILQNYHVVGVAHVRFSSQAASIESKTDKNLKPTTTTDRPSTPITSDLLCSVGCDSHGLLALWDWQTEKVVASGQSRTESNNNHHQNESMAPREWVHGCALHETGRELVTCGQHFVYFYVLDGQKLQLRKPKFQGRLLARPLFVCVAYYSSNGVVVGAKSGVLYQFVDRQLIRSVQVHSVGESVNVCFVACRSMVIFTGGKDGRIRQWDSTISPIGNAVDLHAFHHENHAKMLEDVRITSLDYCFARNRFVVGTRGGEIVQVWENSSSTNSSDLGALSMGLDDHSLLQSCGTCVAGLELQKIASSVHQNVNGSTSSTTRRNRIGISSMAFASEESEFVTCGRDFCVRAWSLRRRELLRSCKLLFEPLTVAISTRGTPHATNDSVGHDTLVAVGGADGSISLLKLKTLWKPLLSIRNTSSAVTGMRFSHAASTNEFLLAVACSNSLIYVYQVLHGDTMDSLKLRRFALLKPSIDRVFDSRSGVDGSTVNSMDFSSDGRFLRSQHLHTVECWDLRGGRGRASRMTDLHSMKKIDWQSHTITSKFARHGLAINHSQLYASAVDVSRNKKWSAFFYENGSIGIGFFPLNLSEKRHLERQTIAGHLESDSGDQGVTGGFALHDSVLLSKSCSDGIVCQWRIVEEDMDEQPHKTAPNERNNNELQSKDGMLLPTTTSTTRHDCCSILDPQDATESDSPELDLSVEWVFGMNSETNPPVVSPSLNQLVYSCGPLGIVYDIARHQQRCFRGHSHRIKCLALHKYCSVAASASCDGCVCVWQVENHQVLYRFDVFEHKSCPSDQVLAMEFGVKASDTDSGDELLAVITRNNEGVCSVVFHNWRRQLFLVKGEISCYRYYFGFFAEATSSSPTFSSHRFVNGGPNHLVFWQLDFRGSYCQIRRQDGVFGRHAVATTTCCGVFIDPFVVTGTINGELILWDGCFSCLTLPVLDEMHENMAIVGLKKVVSSQLLVCVLQSGQIVTWRYRCGHPSSVKPHELLAKISVVNIFKINCAVPSTITDDEQPHRLTVGSVDLQQDKSLIAMLSNGELLQMRLDGRKESFLEPPEVKRIQLDFYSGDEDRINDIRCHPKRQVFATCGESGRIHVYDMVSHALVVSCKLPSQTRSLAFDGGGHLAVALSSGNIVIVKETSLETVTDIDFGGSTICAKLQFSPDGNLLAVVCMDGTIRLLQAKDSASVSYQVRHVLASRQVLAGSSTLVQSLDFSADSQHLMASDTTSSRIAIWNIADKVPILVSTEESMALERNSQWFTLSTWCAGPTEGIQEFCAHHGTAATSLDRIRSSSDTGGEHWKSQSPSIVFGAENGDMFMARYPVFLGEGRELVHKAYRRFHCDGIETTEFSCSNQFITSMSRTDSWDGSNSSMLILWRTL